MADPLAADAHGVERIRVPGAGWATATTIVVAWGFLWAVCASGDWAWIPAWAGNAALAAGPFALVAAGWSAMVRRVVVASRDGVRVSRVVWLGVDVPLWDALWIPREALAFVSIDERETDTDDERPLVRFGSARRRQTVWAVVAGGRSGPTETIASGYATAEGARSVAERIRRATGC